MTTAAAWTASDLAFDAETHTSADPDGRDVPHVTRILSAVGVSTDFDELGRLSRRTAQAIEQAGLRGTALHADAHAYDDDDLNLATVDRRVAPYLDAWIACRQAKGLAPLLHARERRVYHPGLRYAGILDGVFRWEPQGSFVLVDLKTGDPEDSGCRWQVAAYEAALLAEHATQRIDRRWAVWLRPDRRVPFTIVDYTAEPHAWQHFNQFQSFLVTYNLQAGRRSAR